jgi:hypothetical protein
MFYTYMVAVYSARSAGATTLATASRTFVTPLVDWIVKVPVPASKAAGVQLPCPGVMVITDDGPAAEKLPPAPSAGGFKYTMTSWKRIVPSVFGAKTADMYTVAPAGTERVLKCAAGRQT